MTVEGRRFDLMETFTIPYGEWSRATRTGQAGPVSRGTVGVTLVRPGVWRALPHWSCRARQKI